MYTSEIGRLVLEIYREQDENTELSAKELFKDQFFRLMFDDERYLMYANNSKFDQAYKQKKKQELNKERREQALREHLVEVASLEAHESHLFIGGYARKVEEVTYGQVNSIVPSPKAEQVYLSWLGAATGIGLKGGLSLLLKDKAVIRQIIKGWKYYREFMSREPTLKPHQLETWNGWWLTIVNDAYFNAESPLGNLPSNMLDFKSGVTSLRTVDWVKVIFALVNNPAVTQRQIAYVYSFGQTNTTVGFIPIHLHEAQDLQNISEALFGLAETKNIRKIYQSEHGFQAACRQGNIGISALEPKGLRKYIGSPGQRYVAPRLRTEDEKSQFKLYEIWIIAMLNNKDLRRKARLFAEQLQAVRSLSVRGKKVLGTAVDDVLKTHSYIKLNQAIGVLLSKEELKQDESFDPSDLHTVLKEVDTLPVSRVPLFLTLVRIENAFLEYENK